MGYSCPFPSTGLSIILSVQTKQETAQSAGEPMVYKTVEGRQLRLYVVKPADWKAADRRPAIVFFHGGGWTGGRPTQFNEHGTHFAARGMV